MGYVVLHIEKAAGTDAAMSGHVERRITPANVITTLTYLNQELIDFPKELPAAPKRSSTGWTMPDWSARSERTKCGRCAS